MSEGPGLYRLYKGKGYFDFEKDDVNEALADGWFDNPTDAEKQRVAPAPEPVATPVTEVATALTEVATADTEPEPPVAPEGDYSMFNTSPEEHMTPSPLPDNYTDD